MSIAASMKEQLDEANAKLSDAHDRIENLEDKIAQLESEDEEVARNWSAVDDLVTFLRTTERDYPTPALYKLDLDEKVRAVEASR